MLIHQMLSGRAAAGLAILVGLTSGMGLSRAADPKETWFLAVGHGGHRMLSRDGKTWEKHASWGEPKHDQNDLNVAVHFRDAFFAGGGYFSGRLTATRDGTRWSDGVIPGSSPIFGLEVLGDVLYAIDLRGVVFKSTNGEQWERVAQSRMPTKTHWIRSTALGNKLIVGSGDYGPAIAFDPASGTITVTQMDGQKDKNAGFKRVAFGNGVFVVGGQDGLLAVTKDGKTWQNNKTDPQRGDIACVEFTGKDFLATTKKGALRSTDGLTWKPAKGRVPSQVRFVHGWLFGYGWPPSKISRSKDGEVWEPIPNEKGWQGKAYAFGALAGGPPPNPPATVKSGTKPKKAAAGPAVKLITSFEDRNPFSGGAVVAEHATDGKKALRIDRGFIALDAAQNWSSYDYVKADVFTDAKAPVELYVEVRDRQTRDYWTRVNYTTVIPPGKSTLIVPTALYVGEKSRPGRPLMLEGVTRLVFSIGEKPEAPLFIDNIRLERDTETAKVQFDGLWAFDVAPTNSSVMEGFTLLDPGKSYTKGRGYGWKDAQIWRGFDALQPDPLYRTFLCIERGGLAVDVPNGKYHVFVNMDSPSGFWGEFQRYRRRALILEGVRHVDTMNLETFKRRYFRHWDADDLPTDNTFDKYQLTYFKEKHHEVTVRDGQLNIDFEGENWACAVSAIVVYPSEKAEQGKRFLDFVRERRRFHFDNAFKRVLPRATGATAQPAAADKERGFIAFSRDWMKDVNVNDRPLPGERVEELSGSAFAGEYEPVTVSVLPLRDIGKVTLTVADLQGPGGASIPAKVIDVGHVQHRITRVTMEGSVYTISPRLIMPRSSAVVPLGVTRTFWLTVKTPVSTPAGVYRGTVQLTAERGSLSLPLRFTVRKGTLDPVDIPAGPWGHTIDLPWYDDEAREWNASMALRSLKKLREYGFTTASGLPVLTYRGFKDGVPRIDFTAGDEQMKRFKDAGFTMPVVSYCPFHGLNTYYRDEAAMRAAGFSDYSGFIKTVFTAVQKHADEAGWLPVYWNIGDEPAGDDVLRSAANAEAYRKAFPKGPPFFAAASSFQGSNSKDPHFRLSKALHVANWNLHDEAGVKLQQAAGSDWAFYNGGNRWTYGAYMYKATKQYGMKFRLSWHWNAVAGDPYYALDCREDDYAWCNAGPNGELLPSVHFERLREGLGDYRRLLTLARLAKEKAKTPAAREATKLIDEVLGSFKLGERELKGVESFTKLRARLDAAIERLH